MESISTNNIPIIFEDKDRPVAELLQPAVARTMRVLQEHYSIDPPGDCRVYVMRSWWRMFFHAASWPWRVYLALTFPFLALRARGIWPIAGGWAFPLGKRKLVGVKPPDLLQAAAESAIGARIFTPTEDISKKMIQIAAHELTHASTGVIRRHTWLYEGLAMRVADHVAGKSTVKPETLNALAQPDRSLRAGHSRRLNVSDVDALVYAYVRGYWLTRYLEDAHPGLLKDLLVAYRSRADLDNDLAAALGVKPAYVWQQIDAIAVQHFARSSTKHGMERGRR